MRITVTVHDVLYHIGQQPVTIVTQSAIGTQNVETTQDALTAQVVANGKPAGTPWGDDECVVIAQTVLVDRFTAAGVIQSTDTVTFVAYSAPAA